MRTLQLAITCISMSGERVKAVAEIAYVSAYVSNVLGMDVSTPCCSFDVSAPYKEGNTLEQYKTELTANAKEFITGLYKELVCGGEMHSEIVFDPTKILISDVKINYDSNTPSPQELAERIEKLEKSMGNSESLQAMYDIGKKAAADFVNQQVCHSTQAWGWGFRLSWPDGVLKVHEGENEVEPNISHRNEIIAKAIAELQQLNKGAIKQLGRSMALLQIAAEIEIFRIPSTDCRRKLLAYMDNPPLKVPHSGWIAPGIDYLNGRLRAKN